MDQLVVDLVDASGLPISLRLGLRHQLLLRGAARILLRRLSLLRIDVEVLAELAVLRIAHRQVRLCLLG